MTPLAQESFLHTVLPRFDVALPVPDLTPWREGNTGIPGFWHFDSGKPGPRAALTALMHGNEIAGATALAGLLAKPFRPKIGSITLGFCNLDAFSRFDAANPTASRFVDEDMNRVWEPDLLAGPRLNSEILRAREIKPLLDQVDFLLDLHSMLWPSAPLILAGPTARGAALAALMATPPLVVSDHGHLAGRRLIDDDGFADPAGTRIGLLLEAGQHWQPSTLVQTEASITAFLAAIGLTGEKPPPQKPATAPMMTEVVQVVTAETAGFTFLRPYRGGDIIPDAGTLIALDGSREIRTPHDNCMLIMPSLKPSRGHTAVRLARITSP
jgi:predicted deacylase